MTPSIGFSFYRLEHGRVNISAMVIWHEIWHVHVSLGEYLIHCRTLSILENKLNDNKILLSLPLPLSLFSNTTFPLFKKVERKKRVCRKTKNIPVSSLNAIQNDTEYVHIYIFPPPKTEEKPLFENKKLRNSRTALPSLLVFPKIREIERESESKKKEGKRNE